MTNSKLKVYLLLRTHNRPNEFHCCIESISKQSVLPEIIIISDDENDTYIKKVTLPHQVFRPKYRKPQWWIRHHNPFNDYFNQVLTLVPSGHFIYYLDDDDELVYPDWIKTILDRGIDVLIGQFQLGVSHNYKIIGKTIKRKEITTSCIAIKSIIAKNILWPKRQAGDYKFINKVKKNYKINHFDTIIAKAQIDMNRSWGRRKNH